MQFLMYDALTANDIIVLWCWMDHLVNGRVFSKTDSWQIFWSWKYQEDESIFISNDVVDWDKMKSYLCQSKQWIVANDTGLVVCLPPLGLGDILFLPGSYVCPSVTKSSAL